VSEGQTNIGSDFCWLAL